MQRDVALIYEARQEELADAEAEARKATHRVTHSERRAAEQGDKA